MSEEIFPYTILFIEDEDSTRENYVRFLKHYYTDVYEAKDGDEAYKIYLEKKPDILIIDIDLPHLNGLELLEKIRKIDYRTKAIMLTAHSQKEHLLKATELKLTKYLIKPITRQELKEALLLANNEMNKFEFLSKEIIEITSNFYWNIEKNEIQYFNKTIELTQQERKILKLFFQNIETTLSYEKIIYEVWEDTSNNKLDALKTTIKNLRKKLPIDIISNVYGIGYKLKK